MSPASRPRFRCRRLFGVCVAPAIWMASWLRGGYRGLLRTLRFTACRRVNKGRVGWM